MIGVHGVKLNGTVLAANAPDFDLPCPVSKSASCSYNNTKNQDLWVQLGMSVTSVDSTAAPTSISCTIGGINEVCYFSSITAGDAGSCAFILPRDASLQCESSGGKIAVSSAKARPFAQSLMPAEQSTSNTSATCPSKSPKGAATLCDCAYENPYTNDVMVSLSALSIDQQFNSYHCFYYGVNVGAAGTNRNNQGNGASSFFIVPAGSVYNCSMEWGSTAFRSATVMQLSSSIFPPARSADRSVDRSVEVLPVPLPMPTPAMQLTEEQQARAVYDEWRAAHKSHAEYTNHSFAADAEKERRFANFVRFIAMAVGMGADVVHEADVYKLDRASGSTDANKQQWTIAAVDANKLNGLADLSREEFERYSCSGCSRRRSSSSHIASAIVPEVSAAALLGLPSSMDWRTKKVGGAAVLTPVKNQGQCGSCWSFSATGAVEAAWAIGGHGLTSLSEQQLVSCDKSDGNAGCNGGFPYRAIEYMRSTGIDTEASYPYANGKGGSLPCTAPQHTTAAARVSGHETISGADSAATEQQMMAYIANSGPLSISLDAMTQLWWPYKGGVMTGCCNTNPDHAVLLVGYGTASNEELAFVKGARRGSMGNGTVDYWLIKNSWGESWGEGGYIRLERGTNACGITSQPVGAKVGPASPTPPPTPQAPTPPPTPPAPTPPPTPPPPTPPPAPTPFQCPADATLVGDASHDWECLWEDGKKGVTIPPTAREYCDYLASGGYFGYVWPKSTGGFDKYPCPLSARQSDSGSDYFCVIEKGQKGVVFPPNAQADCKKITSSFGFKWKP
jgi:C1A family cysteine protease